MKGAKEISIKPTEEDVRLVKMLADGLSGEEMSVELGVSTGALAFTLSSIRKKYNCNNSINLVAFFLRNKIIE